jgi:hypothetical protein
MKLLHMTAQSKAKAREEIANTHFINFDVLPANHLHADKVFGAVPSKDAIAFMFLCQYPFLADYEGPVFPMYLVLEHQPMDLTGELETDEKLNKWEQDIYKQYSEITPDN